MELELNCEATDIESISITIEDEIRRRNQTQLHCIRRSLRYSLLLVCVVGLLIIVYLATNPQNHELNQFETTTTSMTTTKITMTTSTMKSTTTTTKTTICENFIPL